MKKVGISFTWERESHDPLLSRCFTHTGNVAGCPRGSVGLPKEESGPTSRVGIPSSIRIDRRELGEEELSKSEVIENFWESGKD